MKCASAQDFTGANRSETTFEFDGFDLLSSTSVLRERKHFRQGSGGHKD
jgi:hypothetical protein